MRSFLTAFIAGVVFVATAALFLANSHGPAGAAAGGPVILGGDDLTDHGSADTSTNPPTMEEGWLYIQKALENLSPNVTRPGNDGSVAVLGSEDSIETSDDAGAAYHYAAPNAGLGVTFHNGAAGINQFFTDLSAGNINPAIIVTAGTGADNDLDTDEGAALTANATGIANFVNSGGGLLSHGSGDDAYGWLSALLPTVSNVDGCDEDTLTLTAAGQSAFPGLTNADITSGPCHSNFTGDLAGLQILASDGQNRNIIIGGASVELPGSIDLTPETATNFVGEDHTVTATVMDGQPPTPAVGATVTFEVISGPNAGASGTCTVNADCTADDQGQVSFTYTSNGTSGPDTIRASFVTSRDVTESTLAQKTWEEPPPPEPTATPEPTALAATATPTATPAALPESGGPAQSQGGLALFWIVLAFGAAAFLGGGLIFAHQRYRSR